MGEPRWRPLRTGDGSWTLVDALVGEACHSSDGAWTQALERYARPCRLRERALAGERRLALLDVGTGIGLNLAAAVEAVGDTACALEIVSIEHEPAIWRAALELPLADAPSSWALVRDALRAASEGGILEHALAPNARVTFELGDASAALDRLDRTIAFDAVFLDPFSPRVEPTSWRAELIARIAGRMGARSILSTYSSSFAVRRALRASGLVVGLGPRVGRKASGTLAARGFDLPDLDPRTLRRLRRSLDVDSASGPRARG